MPYGTLRIGLTRPTLMKLGNGLEINPEGDSGQHFTYDNIQNQRIKTDRNR